MWRTCRTETLNLSECWNNCEPLGVLSRVNRFSNGRHPNNERQNKKPQKSGKHWRRQIATKRV
jgi:hypothetical protein